ncbi:MAG: hypothetical protein GY822_08705 [Deltaproteobacteria bacterium]|nr:hypothetical protein [Deltaproteobacteria bacterium]
MLVFVAVGGCEGCETSTALDAGVVDAGTAFFDAGQVEDAGFGAQDAGADSGMFDSGSRDAGPVDAGPQLDAGADSGLSVLVDAGATEAGMTDDARLAFCFSPQDCRVDEACADLVESDENDDFLSRCGLSRSDGAALL